jgi:hypothetical protein
MTMMTFDVAMSHYLRKIHPFFDGMIAENVISHIKKINIADRKARGDTRQRMQKVMRNMLESMYWLRDRINLSPWNCVSYFYEMQGKWYLTNFNWSLVRKCYPGRRWKKAKVTGEYYISDHGEFLNKKDELLSSNEYDVDFRDDGNNYFYVSVIVAIAFMGFDHERHDGRCKVCEIFGGCDGEYVDHLDGNRANNHWKNLKERNCQYPSDSEDESDTDY